jgi:ATP:ADP antiporter, AAA family
LTNNSMGQNSPALAGLHGLLSKAIQINPLEIRAFIWSFLYFFSLLCGYYIIRPVRDALGITGGVENLQWLFTGTFIVMLAAIPLFGWITSNYPRRKFVPYVYYFFISNLLLFFILLKLDINQVYIARAFFIWASVFNLFVVSVFWSFMADIYSNEQAKRLFPVIATGGTSGAIIGPLLTASLVTTVGTSNLLLLSVGFLVMATVCIRKLGNWQEEIETPNETKNKSASDEVMGGGIFDGVKLVLSSPYLLAICLFMVFLTTLVTFLYFQQAEIVRDSFASREERTAVFAVIDFVVNSLTLILQLFVTGRLLKKLGTAWTLALIPVLLMFGFLALGLYPSLAVIIVIQVIRRAGNYAIMRPAREVLYVVLNKEEKYKAKNFIDTVIYRGGDAVSAWAYAGLQAIGLGITAIAFIAIPMTGIWVMIALYLGKQHQRLIETRNKVEEGGT